MQYRSKVQSVCLLLCSMGAVAAPQMSGPQDVAISGPPTTTAVSVRSAESGGLQKAIIRYESLTREHWPALSGRGLIRPGQQHREIAEIRRRLIALGDHPPLTPGQAGSSFYDASLAQALRRFQMRHGLRVDGVIGPNTRQALNITPGKRLRQLRLNAERLEAFRARAPGQYLLVNIPAYQFYAREQGRTVLSMRAIVGRKDRQTPVLSSRMKSVVVNPAWNVPRGIAYKDIVPALKRDRGALKRKGLQLVQGYGARPKRVSVYNINWQRLYAGPANGMQRFWQPPGKRNALGELKFDFPNKHTVYLHGTPNRSLFNKPVRTFSSGCIRLEQPRKLANYLLSQQQSWSEARLKKLIDRRRTRHLRLSWQAPLYLVYWTAWMEDGVVHFRPDVYNRDRADYLKYFPQGVGL